MPFIHINDANYYYEQHGNGHPLVLIAGYSSDHTYWLPILDTLAKHFTVLIFDNRACGQTTDNQTELSFDLLADETIALCDQLGLVKPHVVGQSMGGMIAQRIAIRHPQHIKKLGLLTTAATCREAVCLTFETILRMRRENIALDIIMEVALPWLFNSAFLANSNNIRLFKEYTLNNPYPQSLEDQARQCHLLRTQQNTAALECIKAPTFVVYGRQDIIILPDEATALANAIPLAQLIELDCGHGVVQEVPRALGKILVDKLST